MNDDLRRDVVDVVGRHRRRRRRRRSAPRVYDGVVTGIDGDDFAAVGLFCGAVLAVANVDPRLPAAARADPQDVLMLDDVVKLQFNK